MTFTYDTALLELALIGKDNSMTLLRSIINSIKGFLRYLIFATSFFCNFVSSFSTGLWRQQPGIDQCYLLLPGNQTDPDHPGHSAALLPSLLWCVLQADQKPGQAYLPESAEQPDCEDAPQKVVHN